MTSAASGKNAWTLEFGDVVLYVNKACGHSNFAHQNNMNLSGLDIWDLLKRRPHFQLTDPDLWEHFSGYEKPCQRIS